MRVPFKRSTINDAIEGLGANGLNTHKIVVAVGSAQQKINKSGPFKLSRVTDEYPYFSHLLNGMVQSFVQELPDFSDDKGVAVMSDFGGEHPGARFNTYSFLFLAYDKIKVFQENIRELRAKYGLLKPYSEFSYKDLTYGPRSRALQEYLQLVDKYIHGALITIAISKQIQTVFGRDKQQAHPEILEQLKDRGLGEWKGLSAEKVLRVTNIIAAFVALLTYENQKLIWYCDEDSINENGRKKNFLHTTDIFTQTLGMYMEHKLNSMGLGKSFDEKGHLDDLLSVSDLAAGVVQDLLEDYETNVGISGGEEKSAVIRWIATPSKFLSKITIQIVKQKDGSLGYGLVDMSLK